MATRRSNLKPSQAQADRRRSDRVLLSVAVDVGWIKQGGVQFKEAAETEEINAHGALLRMRADLPIKTLVVLTHRVTKKSTPARVVRTSPERRMGKVGIAVELDEPSETFWGVSIPQA